MAWWFWNWTVLFQFCLFVCMYMYIYIYVCVCLCVWLDLKDNWLDLQLTWKQFITCKYPCGRSRTGPFDRWHGKECVCVCVCVCVWVVLIFPALRRPNALTRIYQYILTLWGHFMVPTRKQAYKSFRFYFFENLKLQKVLCKVRFMGRGSDGKYSLYSIKIIPPVSQTRLKPSPRLKCKSERFQLK